MLHRLRTIIRHHRPAVRCAIRWNLTARQARCAVCTR